MSEIVLQWTPEQGPRCKLTITQTEDSWVRIETVWDGQQWRETAYEYIQNPTVNTELSTTNPTPPTIESLCREIYHTWDTENPQVLCFDTQHDIVIAAKSTALRYYSGQSICWHPIDNPSLRRLTHNHGLPSVTPLADTPYSRAELERGTYDV